MDVPARAGEDRPCVVVDYLERVHVDDDRGGLIQRGFDYRIARL